MLRLWPLDG